MNGCRHMNETFEKFEKLFFTMYSYVIIRNLEKRGEKYESFNCPEKNIYSTN